MKYKFAITTESACDLTQEYAKKNDIKIFPMSIVIGEEEYRDSVDITTAEMYEKARLYNCIPKTCGISPYEYGEVFNDFSEKGVDVIHIALSSKISSCYQNALSASSGKENVIIIDSLNLSAGMAIIVDECIKLRNEGLNAKDAAAIINRMKNRVSTSFILENLEYIFKGGRCSGSQLLTSKLLNIKASVDVFGGKLMRGKSFSGVGNKSRTKYIDNALKKASAYDKEVCYMNYSALKSSDVDYLKSYIQKNYGFNKIVVNEAGCCISSHCGKGCMGIIFKS